MMYNSRKQIGIHFTVDMTDLLDCPTKTFVFGR